MIRKILSGFLLLFPLLSLTGCGLVETKPEIQTIVIKQYPPEELLNDCVAEEVEYTNNESLLIQKQNLESALTLCNQDKLLIRKWKEDAPSSPQNFR